MAIETGEINALLGHGTDFAGKLTFEGTVRIDGRFQGEVFTHDVLIIGEGAEVRAEIDVGTLIVKGGVVIGNIRARDAVEIHAPGRVLGDIASPSLYVGKGVVFDGRCQMRGDDGENVCRPEGPGAEHVGADPVPPGMPAPAGPSDGSLPPRASYPSAPPMPVAAVPPPPAVQAWPPVQIVPPPIQAGKRR
ncbi:MAG: polymer-forming cytoskeletal protein [Deltaproteobacteria bacterium]|nr:polymer-forming cytoskeletal protein [Deltaproteobacteria bacterium]